MRLSLTVAVLVSLLGACNLAPSATGKIVRANHSALTQTYAEFRASQLQNVRYELNVELDPALAEFSGQNRLLFEFLDTSSDLCIDFANGTVSSVIVNGTAAEFEYNGFFIRIPAAALKNGSNTVLVHFRHAWSDTGAGLYRYDDPDDGRTYLYSDFEPYDANLAFPLFDQPDIKARFSLTVTAPADWQVISTSRELSVTPAAATLQTWEFAATLPIPSYVFSLHAGPYAVWQNENFRIPMRLFARQSLAELVAPDAARWFEISEAGLDFFEAYYGVEYPYGKYDHLLVPDFNSDAMENAAAVTYTERTHIQRDGWSYKETKWHIEVILHEMAHQWFGDLVTMKWWNGLWLNETFAEFMGYHAAAAEFGIDDAWVSFYLDRKYVAYWTDQRSTTHPVETPVADTDSVGANFDMISYAKGAAVLRQIEYRLGADTFRRGINIYLKRHATGNTELADFVAALAEASGTDLDAWAQEWLFTAGANTLEAQFNCAAGVVTDFALLQSAAADHPLLRTQKVQVGLLRERDGVVVVDTVLPVIYSGARTALPEAIGKPCPDLVYPNYQDYGYLLVKLDPHTRDNLDKMLGRIADPFQRVMFWQTLWDNVRFAQLPVSDYLDAVIAAAASENDLNNVDQVYAFAGTAIHYLRSMGERGARALQIYRPQLEALMWANIVRTRGDLQTMYLDRYLALVSGDDALQGLLGLLREDHLIPGRDLDQDRRWTILRILSAAGHPGVDKLLGLEKQRDPTDDGRRGALAVEAAWPDPAVKRAIIADVLDTASATPYALQRISMRNLFPAGQEDLHESFADDILAAILANEQDPDPAYYARARGFASYLTPLACTPASVLRLQAAVAAHRSSRTSIRRTMIEKYEDDALCVARAALLD
ncbi:MAG: aminopeptidase N [Woeseia sp.]